MSKRPSHIGVGIAIACIALAISTVAVAPYFFSRSTTVDGRRQYQLIATHDISNHYHLAENFSRSLREGNLYPRWFGEPNNGYGIALMNYYPPGLFYLTSAGYAVFRNWHSTLFVLMTLALAASGISMYFLARTFLGQAASGTAAGLYMVLPYHLLDLYWRGALPEFLGFVFMPLIFYFAYRVGKNDGRQYYAGLGLFFGLHILVQLPVSVLLSYSLALYGLAWAIKERNPWILLRIAVGMSIGFALSAIYWLPAALEMSLVYQNALEIYPYHTSYVSPALTQEPFLLELQYCLKSNVLIVLVAMMVFRITRRPEDSASRLGSDTLAQSSLWMLLCGAALFMATAFSYDISRLLPKIDLALPAFRWLALGVLFGALLAGACVQRVIQEPGVKPLTRLAIWGAFAVVLALNLWASVAQVIGGALENNDFTPPTTWIEPTMTPAAATRPDQLPDTPQAVIEPPGGTSDVLRWESQRREVRVTVDRPSHVRLKTYNFAGWTAWVDGEKTPLRSDVDGIQVVDVPAGQHTVEVRFQNTAPRWAGLMLTLLAWITVLGLSLNRRRSATKLASAQNPAAVSDVAATHKE